MEFFCERHENKKMGRGDADPVRPKQLRISGVCVGNVCVCIYIYILRIIFSPNMRSTMGFLLTKGIPSLEVTEPGIPIDPQVLL